MSDYELRMAIEQAFEHYRLTAPGPGLDRAKEHLQALREIQVIRGLKGE